VKQVNNKLTTTNSV